jgi:hypothetical protein
MICLGITDGTKICVQCGYKIKRKSTTPLPRETFKKARIEKIKQVHADNPNYTQKQLITFANETRYMVIKYWRDPALNTVTNGNRW